MIGFSQSQAQIHTCAEISGNLSQFGAQITLLAIPLLAVNELHATTFEVGLPLATVFFDVSYQSYLPGLVPHETLVK